MTNSSTTGGCISGHVHPQRPFINFSSPKTAPSTPPRNMQRSVDLFAAACDNFGPMINTEKMVMHQPPPGAAYAPPRINVNGAQLQAVENFYYKKEEEGVVDDDDDDDEEEEEEEEKEDSGDGET
nr:unnamed protein product [Spirometra erinaceieuropaei]